MASSSTAPPATATRAPQAAFAALALVASCVAAPASAAPPAGGDEAGHPARLAPAGRLDPHERERLRSDLRRHLLEERQRLRELEARRHGAAQERSWSRPDGDGTRPAPIELRRVPPDAAGSVRPLGQGHGAPPSGAGRPGLPGVQAEGGGVDASQSTVEGAARIVEPLPTEGPRGEVPRGEGLRGDGVRADGVRGEGPRGDGARQDGARIGARLSPEERLLLRRQLRSLQGENGR